MFLRFTGTDIDLRTGKHKGIFTLAYDLRESNDLLPYEQIILNGLLKYFDAALPKPTKFSKKKNSSHKNTISTAWFKDSAVVMMKKVWELKEFLERHDILVEVLQSEKPGYIIYEDNYQVVVDPF